MKIQTDINLASPAEGSVLALVAPNRTEVIPTSEAVEVSRPSETTEGHADYVAKKVAIILSPRIYGEGNYMPVWDTVEDWNGEPIIAADAVRCQISKEWFFFPEGIEIRREGRMGWQWTDASPGIKNDIYECEFNGKRYHCSDTENIRGQVVSHEELHENWHYCDDRGDWVYQEDLPVIRDLQAL